MKDIKRQIKVAKYYRYDKHSSYLYEYDVFNMTMPEQSGVSDVEAFYDETKIILDFNPTSNRFSHLEHFFTGRFSSCKNGKSWKIKRLRLLLPPELNIDYYAKYEYIYFANEKYAIITKVK